MAGIPLETLVAGAGALMAALVVWYWARLGRRTWRQRERNAFARKLARETAPDAGPFTVYLRGFRHPAYVGLDVDLREQLRTLMVARHTGPDGRNGVAPLESVLADILDKEAPLVGLGRPVAGLKRSGAGLVRTSDAEWKNLVTSLLDRCVTIVMTPSANAGTAWEIEQIASRPDWRAKTIYFMPSYDVELIRSLQPFVAGHEALWGTARFVPEEKDAKRKPRPSVTLHALGLLARAPLELLSSIARAIIDVAFGLVLLTARFGKSIGLRSRWAAARAAGRKHGLNFPGYSAKGRLFVLDASGKARTLVELNPVNRVGLAKAVLGAVKR